MLIPFIALLLGFLLVFVHSEWIVDPSATSYLAAAILAGLDTVIGGVRSKIEGKFDDSVFLSGFIVNGLLAASLVYLGDVLGVEQIIMVPAVAFGIQMFRNCAIIRRLLLESVARRGAESTAAGR